MDKLVLFGAGKIGRSFIGQLFAQSGFEVVFVDVFEKIIDELNQKNKYTVIIKSNQPDQTILVKNVRGLYLHQEDEIVKEISSCRITAVSVGQAGLPGVIPLLAKGLQKRLKDHGILPLDIILAENLRNADQYVYNAILPFCDPDFPLNQMAGLIETSIGKMVPIMTRDDMEKDPLQVFAEPYNTLILDKKSFKNPIPDVKGLAPKDHIKAWVDRKSYIHNLGHAAAAYFGHQKYPSARYLYEVLSNPEVKEFTRAVMLQSAEILRNKYPGEFSLKDLEDHIDDLIERFQNRSLGDTVYRVGCDLKRKLHRNDRVLSPVFDGLQLGCDSSLIIRTFGMGVNFRATDEQGNLFPGDLEFARLLNNQGLNKVLTTICQIDPVKDESVFRLLLTSL